MTSSLEKEPEIGAKTDRGTIYAGISPDTGRPFYVVPNDAPLTASWNGAMEYAAGYEGHGLPKGAFRLPARDELNVVFQNIAGTGAFNRTGHGPGGLYWSVSPPSNDAGSTFKSAQWFDRGQKTAKGNRPGIEAATRLVHD